MILAKKHLLDALTLLNSGFGRTSDLTIKFGEEVCTLTSLDPTLTISIGVPVDNKDNLPGKELRIQIEKLQGFLKGISDDKVEFKEEKKTHAVKGASSKIKQPFSAEKQPEMEELDPEKGHVAFPNSLILCSLAKALMPIIRGSINTIMLGAHVKTENNKVLIHGTDSFRLARVEYSADEIETVGEMDIILPLQALIVLERFGGNEDPVLLIAHDNKYQIDLSDGDLTVTLVGPQVAGTYPAVDALLTSEPKLEFEIGSTELTQKCKLHRATAMSERTLHGKFESKSDTLFISTLSTTSINSSIEEGFKKTTGEGELDVTLTFKYMLDAIALVAVAGSEKIKLGLSDETKFVWIRPCDETEGLKIACVIAPVG